MKSPANTSSKQKYALLKKGLIVFIILILALFLARNFLFGTPVDTYAVTNGALRQSVVASGRIISPQRVTVATEMTGRILKIPVKEGQQVERGMLLIQLDDEDERAAIAQTMTSVAQAEAKLRQQQEVTLPTAQQNVKQAQADVAQLTNQLMRIRQLKAKNFASEVEQETAKRNLDVANSRLYSAQLQVKTNEPNGSDKALSLSILEQARANLRLAQVKLAQHAVLAPADGILISRNAEPGDIVQAGQALMLLAAQGDTQIEVQIDEKNLSKLALGQSALGSADAFSDQFFKAQLIYINPRIDPQRGSVEVKLRVNEPPAYLRQDMTVSVDIETAQRNNTLTIPTSALHDLSSQTPWVLVVRDNRTVHQVVTLGLRGDDNIEVLQGLKKGEAVIPVTLGLIKANMRVRVN